MSEQRTTPEQRAALRRMYADGHMCLCGRPLSEHRTEEWPPPLVGLHCDRVSTWTQDGVTTPLDIVMLAFGDHRVLALCDDADALAGARAEVARLRAALATIQQWDCLNPPNTGLCEDFPWLRELVDTALAPEREGETDGNG